MIWADTGQWVPLSTAREKAAICAAIPAAGFAASGYLLLLYGVATADILRPVAESVRLLRRHRGIATATGVAPEVEVLAMTPPSRSKAEQLLWFLKNQTFFGGLPDAALAELVRKGHTKRFAKGAVIFRRGDPGDRLTVIVSGRIKIANVSADAKEVVLNFLEAGDVNGEIAVLDGNARSADAIALEDCEVLVIFARDLMPILSAHPQAMLEIMQVLCHRLRALSAIVEDGTLAMRGRVAKGLLRLAHQHGRTSSGGIRLQLTLSQSDLGRYLGLSRENVSRQLRQLKEANVITMDGPCVVILDATALATIAECGSSN
jgi:CRP/FNR family cyclic AMP-dependent transcriptional regulator